MKCAYHPDREPVGACVNCGKLVCDECKVVLKDRIYCNQCVEEVFYRPTKEKKKSLSKALVPTKTDAKSVISQKCNWFKMFLYYYSQAFKKYAKFSGRSRRKEYWTFILTNAIFINIIELACIGLYKSDILWAIIVAAIVLLIIYLFSFAVLIPSIAVTVRRLHDINESGWWILWIILPIVGSIILIILLAKDSTLGDNYYGQNPKAIASTSDVTE